MEDILHVFLPFLITAQGARLSETYQISIFSTARSPEFEWSQIWRGNLLTLKFLKIINKPNGR